MSALPAFERQLARAAELYTSDPAQSVELADEALAMLSESAEPSLWVRALKVRGCALAYHGRHADSLAVLQQALQRTPAGDAALRTDVLRGLALAYHELGAVDQALQQAQWASEAARESSDPERLADALLSLGVALGVHGDAERALQHNREALALYDAQARPRSSMQALNNIGINCKNLGRHEEALAALQRAQALARQLGETGAAAIIGANLGEPLSQLGRLDEARAAAEEAVRLNRDNGYASGETHARVLLGELLHSQGQAEAARAELEAALALAQRHGSDIHSARIHKSLSVLHKAAGRFELALQHHEAFHEAERRRFNEDSQRQLHALQVQFDLARAQQAAQRAQLESAEFAALSRLDALTGLANRRELDARLAEEFARARRQGHALALAMIDIDDFKQINDRFGHATGDAVLRAVATLLRQHCRAIDLVVRYGGEEFCVVFLEAEGSLAARACEAMRAAIAGHDWAALHPDLKVTASLGLADRGHLDQPQALLAAADTQLYEAKRTGKNRLCVAPA